MAVSILLLWVACSPSTPSNELVVGMDLSYPPFEIIQPDGSPGEISMEITKHQGAYLQRPIRIENISFKSLISSLRTNKVDLVISSMTDTPERRKSIVFSDPYLTIGLASATPFLPTKLMHSSKTFGSKEVLKNWEIGI